MNILIRIDYQYAPAVDLDELKYKLNDTDIMHVDKNMFDKIQLIFKDSTTIIEFIKSDVLKKKISTGKKTSPVGCYLFGSKSFKESRFYIDYLTDLLYDYKLIMSKNAKIETENTVITSSLGMPVNLVKLARKYPKNVIYSPSLHPAAIINLKIKQVDVITQVFADGRLVMVGAKVEPEIRAILNIIKEKICNL